MELFAGKFRYSLSLSEKERGGIKIEKKDTEGALLGFHHNVVAEVLSTKAVNENGFIDQFTSLWRGKDEVQLHNVPPLNMMEAIASAIGGLIGTVIKVDKDDGRDYSGRFLRVKISFDVQEPLMWGANLEFPDDGEIWIDFCYEGLPNYCLIYGKMGHVTRWCKEETLGERASVEDVKAIGQHMKSRLGKMYSSARRRNGSASSLSWRRQFDGIKDGLLSQDSDPFNLLPIIEAVMRGRATRRMMSMWYRGGGPDS
ncbi:hypothetical protein D8674_024404 [Pyrus ussuriensis x Pyrus communis]|uniref:Zinc knuckle CX2CX4HX4C domain-containing protein n=1 Tax=Pyrus ussuriensis x Pyrus communis TaxID=2448454 RepID=A0A5N5H7W3_9ROSA|nr:hypothetical protein D8674_024404 [Pyrus ussuriensis x Pyrus communis]